MAKKRYVSTLFRADEYIETLSIHEKLLFLYLITNELLDLCWIYKVSMKRIAFDTWIDQSSTDEENTNTVEKIMEKFSNDKKVYYVDGYVCVVNFIENQALNPKVLQGIARSISIVPQGIIAYLYSIDSLYISYIYSIAPNLTLPNSTLPNLWECEETENTHAPDFELLKISVQQREKIESAYWKKISDDYLERLNLHIWSKGTQYESHYFTALLRIKKDGIKPKSPEQEKIIKEETKKMTPEDMKRVKAKMAVIQKNLREKTKIPEPPPPSSGNKPP